MFERLKTRFNSLGRQGQAIAALALVFAISLAVLTINNYRQDQYYERLKQELAAEEAGEREFPPTAVTPADVYVSDFKYTVDVKATKDGFAPSNITVKPDTKIAITGSDGTAHFMALAPGSPSPRHFEPKYDITSESMFQMKFVDKGTYSFYDRYSPTKALVVTVSE